MKVAIDESEASVQERACALKTVNSGYRIPPEANLNPLAAIGRDGEFTGVSADVRDITEQKRSEASLKAQRERLYAVLETLPVYVVLLAKDYSVPFANRYFRERFGESGGSRCYEYLFNRTEPCENCESFKVFTTRSPHNWQWTGPDGRNYDIHDYPFTDHDGSTLVLEMGIDVTAANQAQAKLREANETLEQRVAERTAQLGASNEELRREVAERKRTEEVIRTSGAKYRSLFENMTEGFAIYELLYDEQERPCDWRVLEVNDAYTRHTGVERRRIVARRMSELFPAAVHEYLPIFSNVVQSQKPVDFETHSKHVNRHLHVVAYPAGGRLFASIIEDIGARKQAQQERDTSILFLRMVNTSRNCGELLKAAIRFIKDHSGCDAVGIRLKKDSDFPYRETLGFSPGFLEAENRLCECGQAGKAPSPACLCGKVISGRLSPLQTSFTEHGTFWTNDSSALLQIPFDAPDRIRGRCIREGYGSIALLPLHDGQARMGLLQLNARRRGAFTPEALSLWERLADHLATAVAKLQAEEALRDSEARFRNIFDHAATGIAITACDGRFVQCNAAYCNLTGYSQGELSAMAFPAMIHPDDRACNTDLNRQLLEAKIPSFEIENRYLHKSGAIVWVHKYVSLLHDDRDQPTHVVALVTDMTERKQTEEVLRFLGQCSASGSGEDFFQQLARYLARALNMDFVCIDRLTDDQLSAQTLAVFHNGQFEDNVSYALKDTPCGDVVGRQICCFPQSVRQLFPKDAVLQELKAESYLGTTLWDARGNPIGLIAVIGREPLKNPRQAEAILQVSAVRAAGELARLQVETARRESEERYRSLFQNVQEGFYLAVPLFEGDTCRDAVYLDVNPAFERIMGLPREQIIGRRAKELVPGVAAEWLEIFGNVARTGEPVSHQGYSETFQKHFEAFVFRPAPGQFAVLVSDITPRKQFEQALTRMNAELERRVSARTEELAKTNRELEAFCYSVSHDLRAPLRSMDGFSQALLEDYGERLDSQGQDFLHRIRSNSQRMARLIDDLLQLSRLTRSQMQLQRVDLSALAQAAIADLRQSEPSRSVGVRIQPGLTATGDPVLLRTALTNLLQNAWKFTGQRPDAVIEVGTVAAGLRQETGRQKPEVGDRPAVNDSPTSDLRPPTSPVFFVRDNGVGFDMRYADKLFTPFQRLHAMTEFPGTGIGLATVQRALHRHGGRIWVEAAPGLGTTFYFTIEGALEAPHAAGVNA